MSESTSDAGTPTDPITALTSYIEHLDKGAYTGLRLNLPGLRGFVAVSARAAADGAESAPEAPKPPNLPKLAQYVADAMSKTIQLCDRCLGAAAAKATSTSKGRKILGVLGALSGTVATASVAGSADAAALIASVITILTGTGTALMKEAEVTISGEPVTEALKKLAFAKGELVVLQSKFKFELEAKSPSVEQLEAYLDKTNAQLPALTKYAKDLNVPGLSSAP